MTVIETEMHRLRSVDLDGAQIRARRMALGMTVKALAELSGVDRGQITRIEEGEVRPRTSTVGALVAALTKFEDEISGPYDDEDENAGNLVTFRLKGNFGVDVTVQGPVADLDRLEASVERLIARMEHPDN